MSPPLHQVHIEDYLEIINEFWKVLENLEDKTIYFYLIALKPRSLGGLTKLVKKWW